MRIPTFIQSHFLDSENAVLSILKMKHISNNKDNSNNNNNNNRDNSSNNNNKDKSRVVFADSIPNSFVCPAAKYIVRVIPLLFLFPPNSILL